MFSDIFQSGFLSILCSGGSKPLQLWESHFPSGRLARLHDHDIKRAVLELKSATPSANYVVAPPPCTRKPPKVDTRQSSRWDDQGPALSKPREAGLPRSLGISMPWFVMQVKGMTGKQFSFEIKVLDSTGSKRSFRACNFISSTSVTAFACSFPFKIDDTTWNQVEINLAQLTYKAFGTTYVETHSVHIHPNCYLHRVYFADRIYNELELPKDYRLIFKKPKI